MKILLLGGQGQLGWELQRALAPLGELIVPRSPNRAAKPGGQTIAGAVDLSDADGLRATVRAVGPQVIVNAAAWTDVDGAEGHAAQAYAVNAAAPAALAQEAAARGAWLIHYSTDYVFDGRPGPPWAEDDLPAPLNAYGRSKLAGEQAVRNSGCPHLILRSSWLYAARGRNFLRTVLRLAAARDQLEVVSDQIGAPTGCELLADVTAHALRAALIDASLAGIYHVSASGETTRHAYAQHVVALAQALGAMPRLRPEGVRPVSSAARPSPAKRPLNSCLDTRKLRSRFGLLLPDWRAGVERTLCELLVGTA